MKWNKTWPKTPGWYWVYGSLYDKLSNPELAVCRVWLDGTGHPAHVCNGTFLYKSEAGNIVWLPLETPQLPE
jgi:hypothetical protein